MANIKTANLILLLLCGSTDAFATPRRARGLVVTRGGSGDLPPTKPKPLAVELAVDVGIVAATLGLFRRAGCIRARDCGPRTVLAATVVPPRAAPPHRHAGVRRHAGRGRPQGVDEANLPPSAGKRFTRPVWPRSTHGLPPKTPSTRQNNTVYYVSSVMGWCRWSASCRKENSSADTDVLYGVGFSGRSTSSRTSPSWRWQ